MKTILWHWPLASTIVLFFAFAGVGAVCVFGLRTKPQLKRPLIFGALCFGSLAFHYFWGSILAIRSTFDYRLFPLGITRVFYVMEIVAVLSAALFALFFISAILRLESARPNQPMLFENAGVGNGSGNCFGLGCSAAGNKLTVT